MAAARWEVPLAFELPAVPNLNVNTPQQPNVLDQYGKLLQLKALANSSNLQQQLAPLQLQQEQQKTQQATLETQVMQQQQASQAAMVRAWSDPTFTTGVTGSSAGAQKAVGFDPGFDPNAMIKKLVAHGVLPKDAMAQASSFLELSKNLSLKTKDDLSNYKDSHEALAKILEPIPGMKPEDQGAALFAAQQQGARIPGLDPADVAHLQAATVQHLPALINTLGFAGDMADFSSKQADAWKKNLENAETADPLLKMQQNPTEAFSGDKLPASIAYLTAQTKSADHKVSTMATQLLGVANASKGVQLAIDKSKKSAEQSIADGDPAAAAKLLTDGVVAPSQIISARKPEFAQKAFTIAAQLNPQWNAQKAEADYKVAGSPAQVAFFGSAKSLTDKGGTLDQLAAAAKDIPDSQFPIFNTVADAIAASTGSGPVAKYASLALGVSDDYSKVMGGGQGSDSSRTQAMNLVAGKQSPAQRAASIEGIRGAVGSQTASRIGNNTVLQRMYGSEQPKTTPALPGTGKTLSAASIQQAATDSHVSVEEATRQAKAAGYAVQ